MDLKLNGTWTGKMMDAEGFNALSTLQLDVKGNEVKGVITFQLIDDEVVKEQRGEVVGKVDDSGAIFLQYSLAGQGMVRFEGRAFEVRHHARAAFGGTYDVITSKEEPVAGGVALFWLYGDKARE